MLTLHRLDSFNADFNQQYCWYLELAGEVVAEHFLNAATATLCLLAEHPELGRRRKFRHPLLGDLRSFPVKSPFHKTLVFYRVTENGLLAWRLMHGARDLPKRLAP